LLVNNQLQLRAVTPVFSFEMSFSKGLLRKVPYILLPFFVLIGMIENTLPDFGC